MRTQRTKIGLGLLLLGMVLAFNGYADEQPPGANARNNIPETGMAKTLERAQQGDANAQNTVGAAYAAGNGVHKDETKAYRWFKRSARQGHAAAQYNLYLLIRQSALFQDETDDALKWLTLQPIKGSCELRSVSPKPIEAAPAWLQMTMRRLSGSDEQPRKIRRSRNTI